MRGEPGLYTYFKTCKTILCISHIFLKKHENNKHPNQMGVHGGRKRGKEREGLDAGLCVCVQSLTS